MSYGRKQTLAPVYRLAHRPQRLRDVCGREGSLTRHASASYPQDELARTSHDGGEHPLRSYLRRPRAAQLHPALQGCPTMSSQAVVAATIIALVLSVGATIALDRAPSRGMVITGPDEDDLYPPLAPPTDWRRFWRPVSLSISILTAVALTVIPMLAR
jgi:hypothetical protein